jgi:hypothetical protein
MNVLTLALTLALTAQDAPPLGHEYRYFPVPVGVSMEPGGTLYACVNDREMPIEVATDIFALMEYQKALRADDPTGDEELSKAGRLFSVATGTAVKILEYHRRNPFLVKTDSYEVRVLDGPHRGRKGFMLAAFLMERREVPKPKPKPAWEPQTGPEKVKAATEATAKARYEASLRATRERDQQRRAAAEARRRGVRGSR